MLGATHGCGSKNIIAQRLTVGFVQNFYKYHFANDINVHESVNTNIVSFLKASSHTLADGRCC